MVGLSTTQGAVNRWLVSLGPLACASLLAGAARADAGWETAPATRRSGFHLGVEGGLALGAAQGYPDAHLDTSGFFTTSSGVGPAGTVWLGGALADAFNFGLGASLGSVTGGGKTSSATAFVFHLEGFPLFARGGALRDLGLFAEFGAGTVHVRSTDGAELGGGGGSMSLVGAGAFWETWRVLGGHVALGPFAGFQYQVSDAVSREVALVGVRSAFYGGP